MCGHPEATRECGWDRKSLQISGPAGNLEGILVFKPFKPNQIVNHVVTGLYIHDREFSSKGICIINSQDYLRKTFCRPSTHQKLWKGKNGDKLDLMQVCAAQQNRLSFLFRHTDETAILRVLNMM